MLEKIEYLVRNFKANILLLISFGAIICFQSLPFNIILFALVSSVSLFFFIFLLSRIRIKWMQSILTFLFASILVVDFVCALCYNTRVNENIIGSIFDTNIGEATGMLGDIIVPIIFIAPLTIILLFACVGEFQKVSFSIIRSIVLYIIFFIVFSIAAIADQAYMVADYKTRRKEFNFSHLQSLAQDFPTHTVINIYASHMPVFYTDILGAVYRIREQMGYKYYYISERRLAEGMSYEAFAESEKIDKIFLVIGESASSNHMSLYGYPIITTPWMDMLQADTLSSSKCYHYPAITSSLLTRVAVPYIVSAESQVSGRNYFTDYKNLVELANDADYETIWISNQGMVDPYDGYITVVSSFATHREFNIHTQKGNVDRYEDFDLLPIIEKYYNNTHKQLFVIHLEGSHRNFYLRFDENDEEAIVGDSDLVAYNRTIHHTDRVLQKIYEKMPDNSLMLYTSDHGENPKTVKGRFDTSVGNYAFHVPLVLIDNNTSLQPNRIVESYFSPEINNVNNSNIYYILAECLGYKIDDKVKDKLKEESKYVLILSTSMVTPIDDFKVIE